MAPATRGKIRVAVRLRPLSPDCPRAYRPVGSAPGVCDQIAPVDDDTGRVLQFDYVCPEDGSTTDLYYAFARRVILDACRRGDNGNVFAYGQTCSGKTFTMLGTSGSPGILLLAASDVFAHVASVSSHSRVSLSCSYLEIYNNRINCLLGGGTNLSIDHASSSANVTGLRQVPVSSPSDLIDALTAGERRRHVGPTVQNARSSRSHSIFTIRIESTPNDPSAVAFASVVNLVDLAGSERCDPRGASVQRAKEARHINRSLTGLHRVIASLLGAGAAPGHVPYRDTKLTEILKPGLCGRCSCAVIATITASADQRDETMNTLRFASLARRLPARPAPAAGLQIVVDRLQTELNECQDDKRIARLEERNRQLARDLRRHVRAYRDLHRQCRLLQRQLQEKIHEGDDDADNEWDEIVSLSSLATSPVQVQQPFSCIKFCVGRLGGHPAKLSVLPARNSIAYRSSNRPALNGDRYIDISAIVSIEAHSARSDVFLKNGVGESVAERCVSFQTADRTLDIVMQSAQHVDQIVAMVNDLRQTTRTGEAVEAIQLRDVP